MPDLWPLEPRGALAAALAALAAIAALRQPALPPARRALHLLLRTCAAAALAAAALLAVPLAGPEPPLQVVVLEERGADAVPAPASAPAPATVPAPPARAAIEAALRRVAPGARFEVRPFAAAGPDGPAVPAAAPAVGAPAAGAAAPSLPEALGEALARRPAGARTLVLLSGRAAARDTDALLEQAAALGRAGVPVLALPPPPAAADAAVRQSLAAPHRVFPGERFEVRLLVTAPRPGPYRVDLLRDGALEESRALSLAAGAEQEALFARTAPAAGPLRYRTLLRGADGAPVPGGERFAAVEVAPPLAVEYVAAPGVEASPLPALLARAGLRVREFDTDAWLRAPDPPGGGVVVLDDVEAGALGDEGFARLERRLRAGAAGLLVLGGPRGLGSGEYRGARLEELLPATAGPPPGGPDADVGLAIVLDTSLSMFFRPRGAGDGSAVPRKIEVARLSILEVVRALRPKDRIGLLASNNQLTWVRRPDLLEDRRAFEERVMGIAPIGGGINFYSSIREAAEALRATPTRLRHVMLVADSDDVDQVEVRDAGRSEELVRGMAAEGITLSIFAIGYPSDKDVLFLRRMTSLGRGDFYLVPDLGSLPRFFRAEYQRRTGEWSREEEFVPLVRDFNPLLRGLDPASLPPLGGLALLSARPGAEQVLVAPSGTPLLALWGYGRGRAAVFAADSGLRWAAPWAGWGEAERFWAQALQALAPAPAPPALELRAETDAAAGRARFTLRAGDGGALPAGTATVTFAGPAGAASGAPSVPAAVPAPSFSATLFAPAEPATTTTTLPLVRRGVERFEAPLPAAGPGAAFSIRGPWPQAGGAVEGFLAPAAGDAASAAAQARAALEALVEGSGGAWVESPEAVAGLVAPPPARPTDFVFWLLLAALLALAGEVLLRE